jgi:hypothetical protein
MKYEFRLRRASALEWFTTDPVLSAGEPGVELDTGKVKIGDGVKAWTDLPYFLNEDAIAALIATSLEEAVLEGVEGDSAYEVAVNNGFVGTEPQWLASLVGPQGPQGIPGVKGDTGDVGPQGIQGVPGDEGPQGPQGIQGEEGPQGVKGDTGDEGPQGPQGIQGVPGTDGVDGVDGESVTVTLVPEANWPPAADSNPLHLYFRVPDA